MNQREAPWQLKVVKTPTPMATEDPALPSTPCLDRPYPSSQKGGTIVAANVRDLAAHERALANPDMVRPKQCGCGSWRLHVHDRKPRVLAGNFDEPSQIDVLIFRCVACKAVWRVLPRFLARCLWRAWRTVAGVIRGERSLVPARTRQRWWSRLRERASVLVAVLDRTGRTEIIEALETVGRTTTRYDLLAALAGAASLEEIAGLVHDLQPGVRVM